jgi:hypothetical protein
LQRIRIPTVSQRIAALVSAAVSAAPISLLLVQSAGLAVQPQGGAIRLTLEIEGAQCFVVDEATAEAGHADRGRC